MKRFSALVLALALLTACATPAPNTAIWIRPPQNASFTVNQFVAVALEYQGSRALTGVDTYGPTAKEFECERSAQAGVSQSDDLLPHGHTLVTTCLHVMFGGPLPRGAALSVPVAGTPFEYVTIGIEYSGSGEFVGAQALHAAPDVKTCMHEAHDVIDTNYKGGTVAAGNSLLLYCVPVPVLEQNSKNEGGIV